MGIAHSDFAEDRARAARRVENETLGTTDDTEVIEPTPVERPARPEPPTERELGPEYKVRDELVKILKSQRPSWTAEGIDDEAVIGIETDSGEFFIEVQPA
jgi:hypothetical protein